MKSVKPKSCWLHLSQPSATPPRNHGLVGGLYIFGNGSESRTGGFEPTTGRPHEFV